MELFCPRIAEMDPAGVEALHHFDIEPRVHWGVPLIRNDGQPEEGGRLETAVPRKTGLETARLETAKGCHKVIDLAGRGGFARFEVALNA
jgi:hypothetical protein